MISVVVPTYNRRDIIVKTLKSIEEQSYNDWECIIVDDFSTDNTKDVIEQFVQKDKRFLYYLNERKKGAPGARNTGLIHSRGEYVVLFDSDNIMHADFLQKTYNSIIKDSVDICGAFSHVIDRNTDKVLGEFKWTGYGHIHNNLMTGKSYFDNSSTLIKKTKIVEIGLLDEDCPSYQEWDTHIRLSKIATYTTIQEHLVDYYSGGADTISFSKERDIKGVLYILEKYKREWLFCHPMIYLRRLISVYDNLQSLKSSNSIDELYNQYIQGTNFITRLLVLMIYKLKR